MGDSAREIENLVYAYAERIDAGDFDGVAELFAQGSIESGGSVVASGSDEVRALYESTTRRYDDGTPRTRHVTTNVAVTVDNDRGSAAARSSYMVVQATDVLPLQPIIVGRYHDTFRRGRDGWAFDVREIFIDLTGDLSQHLLFEL